MTALPDLSQVYGVPIFLTSPILDESNTFFGRQWRDEETCGFCGAKLSDKMRRLRHEWYCHIRELFPTD